MATFSSVIVSARRLLAALVMALMCVAAGALPAEAAPRLERVGTFDQPVYVTSPPGDPSTLAVVERYGRVRLVRSGRVLRRPLLDLRRVVRIDDANPSVDQRGLLSIAFAPDYGRSRRIYVDYVDRRGRLRVAVVRARRERTLRTVLDLGRATTQHHGGQLQFRGSMLYVSTGIGDDPDVSQDPGDPGGKILRLDPRVRPATPEVFALGLRNPWRFSFDRDLLFIGDVGEDLAEEVNVVPAASAPGVNFGWPWFEGHTRLSAGDSDRLVAPALVTRHRRGWCSTVGGYVVRDRTLPGLRGRYVYGDVCTGSVRSARVKEGRLVDDRRLRLRARIPFLVSFGEDGLGRVYVIDLNGRVQRLVDAR